ncbi:hypothetical protein AB6813_18495 [bacterium RCC_150]
MAGYFELLDAPEGGYRVALVDDEDYLVAMSVTFPDGGAAARGIANIRAIAGAAVVKDRRHGHADLATVRAIRAEFAPEDEDGDTREAAEG